eukprot:gene2471-3180_t
MNKIDYHCIECGTETDSLSNEIKNEIRLNICKNCNQYVDKYIEYEFIIIFIDLLLHKIPAYRHIIYNLYDQKTIKQQLFKIFYFSILFQSCNYYIYLFFL